MNEPKRDPNEFFGEPAVFFPPRWLARADRMLATKPATLRAQLRALLLGVWATADLIGKPRPAKLEGSTLRVGEGSLVVAPAVIEPNAWKPGGDPTSPVQGSTLRVAKGARLPAPYTLVWLMRPEIKNGVTLRLVGGVSMERWNDPRTKLVELRNGDRELRFQFLDRPWQACKVCSNQGATVDILCCVSCMRRYPRPFDTPMDVALGECPLCR